ncbi:MAG: PorP/SprF family type IX secretion system membrane protein [Saprospiraceae bacterium]|nr:PorP/SprF family type IX secretion system membrane protein [Saprospiraceae bacterium]
MTFKVQKYYILLIFILIHGIIKSQDISFSQYNLFQTYYNPVLSGMFEGTVKVSLINRDQWIKFVEDPYRSFGITGDIKFDLKNQDFRNDYLSLGAYFLSDRAQLLDWNKNEMGVGLSYYKKLDKFRNSYLSGGIGIRLLQRSLSYDNIYFQDQFDGLNKYDNPTQEILPINIHTTPDLKIGLGYQTQISSRWNMQLSSSIHYIFRPNFSFFKNLDDINYRGSSDYKALIRTNTIFNFVYEITKYEQIIPRIFIGTQGPHTIIQIGTGYRKSFYSINQTALHTAVSLRNVASGTSITPVDLGLQIGFEIKSFIIGLHYDIGLRDAIRFSNPTHSFELGLTWIGNYDNDGYVCPKF